MSNVNVSIERKLAVVGAGFWGKNLIRNFYELGALSIICDTNKELEEEYKSRYPDIYFTEDFKELLNHPEIDALIIATPASWHYNMTKGALLANKHVFVEKPLALNVNEGRELVDLAEEKGLILMVGHILRYHPAIDKLKDIIDKGELGKIQYIYSNRLNIRKIRTEENILWSFAPHDISTILFLLNELPESASAQGESYIQYQIPDVTMSIMNFRNGVKAHIYLYPGSTHLKNRN